ncbi:hypothetical protein IAT38_002839 [Cryptococcus sp. DSM 104549]
MSMLTWPPPEEPSLLSLPLPHPEAYEDEPREYARALMDRRDAIEKEIGALNDVLTSHGVNQSTPLVDGEGFPRGDLDIYAIRHARSSLVRLQNDRSAITELLSVALQNAFVPSTSSSRPNGQVNGHAPPKSTVNGNGPTPTEEVWPESAVAKVNSVAPGSPAAEAGLRAQDMIYSFAGVTSASSGGLQSIGAKVVQSEGVALPLLVLRGQERVRLSLTPRNGWGGRGSLGCHIVPA